MDDVIFLEGVIKCNPKNLTRKHEDQSSWKRVAFIDFGETDVCRYYSWFMKKKYNLNLLKTIRTPHVTIINDRIDDFNGDSLVKKEENWSDFCETYNGHILKVGLDIKIKGNGKHYWLNVIDTSREEVMVLRRSLGLDRPFSGMHMTIGRIKDEDLVYSNSILNLMINYNG